MTKSSNKKYISMVGKRKSSVARLRLFRGNKENFVNEKKLDVYFPGKVNEIKINQPFILTETFGKYFFTAKVSGGGKDGQLDALVLALSKALKSINPEKYKTKLRKEGLLTRDSRIRSRRMVGMGGKSRRKKQSPKR